MIALGTAAFASGALAQQPTQAQASAIRSACRADYQANCSSVPAGGMASVQCLQQHMSSLSSSCGQAVAAVGASAGHPPSGAAAPQSPAASSQAAPRGVARSELQVAREDCAADYRRYCRTVRPGGGRAIGCLSDHAEVLSPSCRGALSSFQQGH
jgi:hypothetical protein